MKVCALIPAKGFVHAKNRLSPVLGVSEREVLAEAMDAALAALGARDARGFFDHCGCQRLGQLLSNTRLPRLGYLA